MPSRLTRRGLQYLEAYKGQAVPEGRQGQICLHIWVGQRFQQRPWAGSWDSRRSWQFTDRLSPPNLRNARLDSTRLKGDSIGSRREADRGRMETVECFTGGTSPTNGLPLFHIRHFPSIEKGAPPSILELVSLGAENYRYGEIGGGPWQTDLYSFGDRGAFRSRPALKSSGAFFQFGVHLRRGKGPAQLGMNPVFKLPINRG